MSRTSFRDRLAEYFKSKPNVWIGIAILEDLGGRYAWRTRVSDCRTELGMDIENRQRRVTLHGNRTYMVSEYRYVPRTPTGAVIFDANAPTEGRLF